MTTLLELSIKQNEIYLNFFCRINIWTKACLIKKREVKVTEETLKGTCKYYQIVLQVSGS